MSDFAMLTMGGRLGRDVELRYTPNGNAVASFSVASSRKIKERETTFWATVEAWGRLAEVLNENIGKGDFVCFTARPKTDSWENSEGERRTRDIYTIDQMISYPRRENGGGNNGGSSNEAELPI